MQASPFLVEPSPEDEEENEDAARLARAAGDMSHAALAAGQAFEDVVEALCEAYAQLGEVQGLSAAVEGERAAAAAAAVAAAAGGVEEEEKKAASLDDGSQRQPVLRRPQV